MQCALPWFPGRLLYLKPLWIFSPLRAPNLPPDVVTLPCRYVRPVPAGYGVVIFLAEMEEEALLGSFSMLMCNRAMEWWWMTVWLWVVMPMPHNKADMTTDFHHSSGKEQLVAWECGQSHHGNPPSAPLLTSQHTKKLLSSFTTLHTQLLLSTSALTWYPACVPLSQRAPSD